MIKKERYISLALAALVLLPTSCERAVPVGKNDASKRFLDSWVTIQKEKNPGLLWRETALGSYVLEEIPGTGPAVGKAADQPYLYYEYTVTDLEGNKVSTSYETVAKQWNEYDPTAYYGPVMAYRASGAMYAGLDELVSGMKVGGYIKAVIPGWLISYKRYSSAADYQAKVTGTDVIYSVRVKDSVEDIKKWEIDSLGRYITDSTDMKVADSLKFGYYYKQVAAPSDVKLPKDTSVYINYVGRLLNGLVFDTNVADTAKYYGIYSSKKTYSPSKITMAEKYKDIKMGSSSTVDGFAYTLSLMHAEEKGRAIFWSGLGYENKSNGKSIPAFSPLIFDIELVAKP